MDGELRQAQVAVLADGVELGVLGVDPIGELFAQPALERQHVGGPAQLQDVLRVIVVDEGGDRHLGGHLAHRQRNVGVVDVPVVGHDEPGL